jgi:hypothetical protein
VIEARGGHQRVEAPKGFLLAQILEKH